ncbi:hypothetical protein NP233_g8449 [Leucocoprinus birnbaumii]|uniref:Uncharacterized protein n=1 Tax=Leucocoprinus birnbaumii TaxID=56174 RepID=A0AAD5VQX5_9AGAR|nr:hypothetical protein NP233_g8449 [Leucocoprinus birnbaumii]
MKFFGLSLFNAVLFSDMMAGVLGATITLYNIPPPSPTGTLNPNLLSISADILWSVSPVSTRSDGKTVYDEVMVITKDVWYNPSTTTTVTSGIPSTTTHTVVEDANGLEESFTQGPSFDAAAIAQSCSFQGTTAGGCMYSNVLGTENIARTEFTSFTGVPTPVYTITVDS